MVYQTSPTADVLIANLQITGSAVQCSYSDSTVLGALCIPQELVTGLPTEPHIQPNIGTIILTRIKLIIEANNSGDPWKINWISILSLEIDASNLSLTHQPTKQTPFQQ